MSFNFKEKFNKNKKFFFPMSAFFGFFVLFIAYQNCGGGGGGGGGAPTGSTTPMNQPGEQGSGEDGADGGTNGETIGDGSDLGPKTKKLVFTTGQAASLVIGQSSFEIRESGYQSPNFLFFPTGLAVTDTGLYITASSNHRLLYLTNLPESGAVDTTSNATIINSMDSDFSTPPESGTSSLLFDTPHFLSYNQNQLTVADTNNNRILIYDPLPIAAQTIPKFYPIKANESDKGHGCHNGETVSFNGPLHAFITNNKMIVADTANSRVLIWNSIPTDDGTQPNLVLGRASLTDCVDYDAHPDQVPTPDKRIMTPTSVWSDGTKLIVVSPADFRVLIWNEFPTTNNEAPDLVLGQESIDQVISSVTEDNTFKERDNKSFAYPFFATSDGNKIFVSDGLGRRVMIWNAWPTGNNTPANAILGDSDEIRTVEEMNPQADIPPTASNIGAPVQLQLVGDKLYVVDNVYNRVLMYKGTMQ